MGMLETVCNHSAQLLRVRNPRLPASQKSRMALGRTGPGALSAPATLGGVAEVDATAPELCGLLPTRAPAAE
eukprot:3821053-Lingulodinium_polyedra.AAC.1